jgi:hypothetical protein
LYVLTSKFPGGQALLGFVPILLKMNDKGVDDAV